MQKRFVNVVVEVDDLEDRLVSGEELTVQLVWNEDKNTFQVTVPEAKKATAKEDKPKPENAYTGLLTKIKGTITVRGTARLTMDMQPALIKALGVKTVKGELNEAFNAVIDKLELSAK